MATMPKILIVDDEPFNVEYLEQELEDEEYQTVTAVNGQDALNKVESTSPDLVLLDIMMPVMDGFEVLRRLKANPATRDIPVIVISASNNLESVVRGIQLGAEDYLPKPFEPVLLRARLSSCLEKKQLRDLEHRYLQGLEHEMNIAREIQEGFLPTELPKAAGWELAAYLTPAREVAGDFYDAFMLEDGSLVGVIGDVCGKGVGAALFMTLFRSLIRATFTTDAMVANSRPCTIEERLHQVVSFTNHYVAQTHADANMFATVFISVFAPQYGKVAYVNCGQEPVLWSAQGRDLVELRPTGPVVGLFEDAHFTVKCISMKEGDLLLAYTDGIPDAHDVRGSFYGKDCLPALINDGDRSPDALLARLQAEISRFVGAAEQFDDITVMAVKKTTGRLDAPMIS